MSKTEKTLSRLKAKSRDFTWNELKTIMESFGYEMKKTGGSGRKFIHKITRVTLYIHEPHPAKILKAYQVAEAIDLLTKEGHLH